MAIHVDAALWPEHGTHFAHLVSDRSLAELHEFAEALGLSVRAFDLDHYDLPAALRDRAVELGARPGSRREILAALTRSGIRVPGDRREQADLRHRLEGLRLRWHRLGVRLEATGAIVSGANTLDDHAPDTPAPADPAAGHRATVPAPADPAAGHRATVPALADRTTASTVAGHRAAAGWTSLGEDLLRSWSQPHRHYHDTSHLLAVLDRLDRLTGDQPDPHSPQEPPARRPFRSRDGAVPVATLLAAWWHDAVHEGVSPRDEEESAALAVAQLGAVGVASEVVADVEALVLSTRYSPAEGSSSSRRPANGTGTGTGTTLTTSATRDAGTCTDAGPGVPPTSPAAPGTADFGLLQDADLGVLAGGESSYRAYVRAVREEYAHVPDEQFRAGRVAVLRDLLARESLFSTEIARREWEARARANLHAELRDLSGGRA